MITCSNCSTQNVDGVRFCVQCGTALAPPTESWRSADEANAPLNYPSSGQSGASGYAPPYATPPPPPSPPHSFAAPLPAMSYGTHGTSQVGGAMQYAEWGERALGGLIDAAIYIGILIVLGLPLGILGAIFGGGDPGVVAGAGCFSQAVLFVVLFGFGIFNDIYLRSTRGASIGQGVMKLKTVNAEGNTPTVGPLVIRYLVKQFIGNVTCGVGALLDALWPLWDEKKQTLHDKVGSTFVVKNG